MHPNVICLEELSFLYDQNSSESFISILIVIIISAFENKIYFSLK